MNITTPLKSVDALLETWKTNFENKNRVCDGNATVIATMIAIGALAICEAIIYHAETTKPHG